MEVGDEAVAGKIALGCSAGCLPFALQICPSPLPILFSTSEAGLYGLQPRVPLPYDFQLCSASGKPQPEIRGREEREAGRFTPSAPHQPSPQGLSWAGCLPQPRLLVLSGRWSLSGGLSYSSPSGIQWPSLSMYLPSLFTFSPWVEPEKVATSLEALHLGPCDLKLIPLLNSSQITQFAYAICFLLGSLLIQEKISFDLEKLSYCDP